MEIESLRVVRLLFWCRSPHVQKRTQDKEAPEGFLTPTNHKGLPTKAAQGDRALPSVWSKRFLETEDIRDQVVGLSVGDDQIRHVLVIRAKKYLQGKSRGGRHTGDIHEARRTVPTRLIDLMAGGAKGCRCLTANQRIASDRLCRCRKRQREHQDDQCQSGHGGGTFVNSSRYSAQRCRSPIDASQPAL